MDQDQVASKQEYGSENYKTCCYTWQERSQQGPISHPDSIQEFPLSSSNSKETPFLVIFNLICLFSKNHNKQHHFTQVLDINVRLHMYASTRIDNLLESVRYYPTCIIVSSSLAEYLVAVVRWFVRSLCVDSQVSCLLVCQRGNLHSKMAQVKPGNFLIKLKKTKGIL